MTAADFKQARSNLGLSQRQLAEVWSMGRNGERTIRRWEQGDVPVNPIAAYCIALMLGENPTYRATLENHPQAECPPRSVRQS